MKDRNVKLLSNNSGDDGGSQMGDSWSLLVGGCQLGVFGFVVGMILTVPGLLSRNAINGDHILQKLVLQFRIVQ